MRPVRPVPLTVSISLPLFAGFIGSSFTYTAIDSWYAYIRKPWFTPPDWIFAPVWTTLYILMGISLYIVWISPQSPARRRALLFFFAQLALNTVWSILFFGLQSPSVALYEILVLWLAIYGTIRHVYVISSTAAALMYPYIAWVSFAAVLNFSVAILN